MKAAGDWTARTSDGTLVVVAVAVALFALAPPSFAAVASGGTSCPGGPGPGIPCTSHLSYEADPGEVNRVTVTDAFREDGVPGGVATIRDSAAIIRAEGNCKRRDLHTVDCTFPDYGLEPGGTISTGDLDDSVSSVAVVVDGGPGADTLTAVDGCCAFDPDSLVGGPGDDVLDARQAFWTSLNGGPGDDQISGNVTEDVVYPGREPVEVNLARGVGGSAGEQDIISGPAGVIGGSAADHLFGDSRRNRLHGGGGGDVITGGGSNDSLFGGRGSDFLVGGGGNDRIFGASGNDRLRGQAGSDGLAGEAGNDRLGGGKGRDRLFGGSGEDLLSGNLNRDFYLAGSGNDRVRSVDGVRERVNCGTGFDRALVDRIDRVRRCNIVTRRR